MDSDDLATSQPAPGRPRRQRRLVNGQRQLVRNTASAGNARPKKVVLRHGGASRLLRNGGMLDRRGTLAKVFFDELATLAAHLAGAPSPPQARLIEQAATTRLLTAMASAELQAAGRLIRADGTAHPAVDVLLRVMREQREVLKLLGLERRAKPLPSLAEVLRSPAPDKNT